MHKHELSESLLSSSTKHYKDRKEISYEGEEDLRRLRRKIIPSLPEQQVDVQNYRADNQNFLKPFNPQSSFITIWNVVNIFLIYLYFLEIPIALTFGTFSLNQRGQSPLGK